MLVWWCWHLLQPVDDLLINYTVYIELHFEEKKIIQLNNHQHTYSKRNKYCLLVEEKKQFLNLSVKCIACLSIHSSTGALLRWDKQFLLYDWTETHLFSSLDKWTLLTWSLYSGPSVQENVSSGWLIQTNDQCWCFCEDSHSTTTLASFPISHSFPVGQWILTGYSLLTGANMTA